MAISRENDRTRLTEGRWSIWTRWDQSHAPIPILSGNCASLFEKTVEDWTSCRHVFELSRHCPLGDFAVINLQGCATMPSSCKDIREFPVTSACALPDLLENREGKKKKKNKHKEEQNAYHLIRKRAGTMSAGIRLRDGPAPSSQRLHSATAL